MRARHLHCVLLIGACAVACGAPPPPTGPPSGVVAEPEPAQGPSEEDLLAPRPFTADEIREASPAGRTYRFKLDGEEAKGAHVEMEFVEADEDGCTMERRLYDAKGEIIGEAERKESTWEELMRLASYPKDATTIAKAKVVTPAGEFDGVVYTMTEIKNGRTLVTRASFATSLPGAPVKLEREKNGRLLEAMILESHRMPGDEPIDDGKDKKGKKP